MARFTDTRTGVVVDVDDATASTLRAVYEPVDEKAPAKKAASSKSEK